MIADETRAWFRHKVGMDPDFVVARYVPEIDRIEAREEHGRDQAIRKGGIEEIKYAQGRLDGVREVAGILNTMRLADTRTPAGPGLTARILGAR